MRQAALVIPGMALAGCGDESVTEGQDLATLRSVTAPFKSFEVGKAADYTAPFMGCFANDSGAMGIHYQNPAIEVTATPTVTCQFAPQTAAMAHH